MANDRETFIKVRPNPNVSRPMAQNKYEKGKVTKGKHVLLEYVLDQRFYIKKRKESANRTQNTAVYLVCDEPHACRLLANPISPNSNTLNTLSERHYNIT